MKIIPICDECKYYIQRGEFGHCKAIGNRFTIMVYNSRECQIIYKQQKEVTK